MLPNSFLDTLVQKSDDQKVQEYVDSVLYFFLDKGVSYEEFRKLPLPYIFSMLNMAHKEYERQKKDMEKSKRKR